MSEDAAPADVVVPTMADAAEMLWVVLANVSGGDWTKQSAEWQEAAARWRDNYFAALRVVAPQQEQEHGTLTTGQMNNIAMRLIGIRDTLTTIPVPIIKRNIDMAIEELRAAAVDPPPDKEPCP